MVLEVTAKDSKGKEYSQIKSYYPIGIDLDGYMRYGAWQIKEIIDLTLQPLSTQHEKVVFEFGEGVTSANVDVKVFYYISGKKGDVIYSISKKLIFEE